VLCLLYLEMTFFIMKLGKIVALTNSVFTVRKNLGLVHDFSYTLIDEIEIQPYKNGKLFCFMSI